MNRKDALPPFIQEALGEGREVPAAEQRELETTMVAIAEAVGREAPPAALKNKLLAAATSGPTRFAPFFDELGRLFDLGADAVMRILERTGLESEWEAGPHPAIRVFHLQPGPLVVGADAGFVRMPPAFVFAQHRHSARERVLILEGGYREGGGRLYLPGDIHEMEAGTEHSFTVLPGGPLMIALVLHGQIQML